MTHSVIGCALLAVRAAGDGDASAARAHIGEAQQHARVASRRDRQVVEIAALVVTGHQERAAGLAREHSSEFPDDADLLAAVSSG